MKVGLLVDLRGIQDYVFSSNRLKDNVGASYIVSHIFDGYTSDNGFCGGGNLFRICADKDEAKDIIRELSKKMIEESPGLSFNAVFDDFDENNFKESYESLQGKLQLEKNNRLQQSTIPSHGITAQCAISGESIAFVAGEKEQISETVRAKVNASNREGLFKRVYKEKDYILPDKFEDLGHDRDNESYIAVVNIDGNEIGKMFLQQSKLEDCKDLSTKLNKAFEDAMESTINELIEDVNSKYWKIYSDRLKLKDDKLYLPIIPLFIGGDDLCFVCDGRLGIVLAQSVLEKIRQNFGREISCCAGVAVAKLKYPFYQVYRLANSLCRSAKNQRKKDDSKDDYLDFHLISGAVSTSLEDVRKDFYELHDEKKLYERPYTIDKLEKTIKASKEMYKKWPNSKIKELRSVLYQGEAARKMFVSQIQSRQGKDKLSMEFDGLYRFDDSLFSEDKTYLLDMIELMEMIPLEAKQ